MAKKYRELEEHIINTFNNERRFSYNGKDYDVILATKPRPSAGECKTDVYVVLEDNQQQRYEVKISVKRRSNNEFQENKVTAEKAEAYFGTSWRDIISRATYSIKDRFESRPLIYQSGKHPTKPNSITLGWKLEIATKERALSVKAPLTDQEIRDYVFKGTNQVQSKCNAYINGQEIRDSGVASYLLATEIEDINNVSDVFDQMFYIDTMALPEIYLIFTANNYRTDVDSADGPRALAVNINWECANGRLTPLFEYNSPLEYTGEGDMRPILLTALEKLGKKNPQQFDRNCDVCCSEIVLP